VDCHYNRKHFIQGAVPLLEVDKGIEFTFSLSQVRYDSKHCGVVDYCRLLAVASGEDDASSGKFVLVSVISVTVRTVHMRAMFVRRFARQFLACLYCRYQRCWRRSTENAYAS